MAKRLLVALTAPFALVGCHDDSLPSGPPQQVTQVATGGFTSPTDAVASPDGRTFYFAAYMTDVDKTPALWETPSEDGSTAQPLVMGDPLQMPIGLVLSCDGKTLYVADMGDEAGSIQSTPTDGGALTAFPDTGIVRPGGLAMGPDCKTLYVTGKTGDGKPALFSVSVNGGAASTVYSGDPLVSPTGLHVDHQGVAWVMDHLAQGDNGEGVLFAIPSDGSSATEVVSDLRMGTPGGVSLTAGGGTAVMPTIDHDGHGQLTTVNIKSGERVDIPAPMITDPAGLRTARKAGVFAVVDSEGGAIFRAE
jgi:DNA-binding beta-propeller fold protein YncE